MKKLQTLVTRLLVSFFTLPLIAALAVKAAPTPSTGAMVSTPVPIPCPLPGNLCSVPGLVGTLSVILFPLVGLALFAMLIYGGVTKLTAAGDAEKEKKAMKIIQNSIIGAIIIALAGVIVTTIGALLGVNFFGPTP